MGNDTQQKPSSIVPQNNLSSVTGHLSGGGVLEPGPVRGRQPTRHENRLSVLECEEPAGGAPRGPVPQPAPAASSPLRALPQAGW